jgi:hypothetical protein
MPRGSIPTIPVGHVGEVGNRISADPARAIRGEPRFGDSEADLGLELGQTKGACACDELSDPPGGASPFHSLTSPPGPQRFGRLLSIEQSTQRRA